LWKEGYWTNELAHLRTLLAEDVAAASNGSGKEISAGSPPKADEDSSDRTGQ